MHGDSGACTAGSGPLEGTLSFEISQPILGTLTKSFFRMAL